MSLRRQDWYTPGDESVTGVAGETIAVGPGLYSRRPDGSLQVNISPLNAVKAGAKWHLTELHDSSTWFDSGYLLQIITPGSYTLESKIING